MRKGWMRHLDFILVDLFSILAVFSVGYLIVYKKMNIEIQLYGEFIFILVLIHLTVAFLTEAYEDIVSRGLYRELMAVIKQVAIASTCFMVYIYVDKSGSVLFQAIFLFALSWIFSMYVARIAWKRYLQYRYKQTKYVRQIFVVTTREEAEKMLPNLSQKYIRNYDITGFAIVDEDMSGETIGGIEVKTNRAGLLSYIGDIVVDEVLLNIPDDSEYEWKLANDFLMMGITVHIYMQRQYEKLPNKYSGNLFGYDVLTSTVNKITFRQMLLKRLMDIAGGIVGLMLAFVLGIIVCPIIYIKSPGPLLFSQIRVGKSGRKFRIYKFRSMYMDAEERKKELMAQNEMNGLMFKMKDDPRIIKGIGHFIRKTSIDEMPQFWNVLKGDMSLVGTRPPTVDEYMRYEAHHRKRLSMRPGITGLWQISGRSSIMDFEEVVKLDVEYIEHYSLEQDIKILVKTVLVVITGKGAA